MGGAFAEKDGRPCYCPDRGDDWHAPGSPGCRNAVADPVEALQAAVLNVMPNRCCEDWRTCPYDRHEGGQIVDALLPFLSEAWEAGFTAGMSQSHSSLNRFGYIERGRDEGDLPNPYSPTTPTQDTP